MQRYTVKQLSALSGVSVRTLHYYDEIGLLKPAQLGANGYRLYGRAELLRLQQVLFYRALRLPLEQVRLLMDDPAFDQARALHEHRGRLQTEAQVVNTLIQTIDKTLADLKGHEPMKDEELFAGFSPQQQREHEQYLVQRYGPAAQASIDTAQARTAHWKAADHAAQAQRWSDWAQRFARLVDAGQALDGSAVQALMAEHHHLVCEHWTPDREAYIGLGRMYVEHPDFARQYDKLRPGLAAQIAQAMEIFALRQL